MLAAQSTLGAYDSILKTTTNSVRNDIDDMQLGGSHYVTPDINQNLNRICRGVNYMHLDTDILNSSLGWARKFNLDKLATEKAGASRAMDKASSVIGNVKQHTTQENVKQMQDNEVREMHQWTMNNLHGVQNELQPFKEQATSRLRQFCDHVGVTDRYTGYRQNLTRGSKDPVRMGFKWLDKSPNEYNASLHPRPHPTSAPPKSRQVTWADTSDVKVNRSSEIRPVTVPVSKILPERQSLNTGLATSTKSIQERCGINMNFPGRTEYMLRYTEPQASGKVDYTINPTPNFMLHGRPLGEPQFYPQNTEYQFRYEWPDSEKITKLPWLRK